MFSDNKPRTTLRFHTEVSDTLTSTQFLMVKMPKTDVELTVNPFPTLTEHDIRQAEIYNTSGGKAILLRFNPHGMTILTQITTENRGHYIVVFLNSRVVAVVLIQRPLTNGEFLLEGDFSDEEAIASVKSLNTPAKRHR